MKKVEDANAEEMKQAQERVKVAQEKEEKDEEAALVGALKSHEFPHDS
jgi:hypothetical protein